MTIELVVRFAVDDAELSDLHARAFGHASVSGAKTPETRGRVSVSRAKAPATAWSQRLERHALTWIGAFDGDRLVGFVQVCWDGGSHAFVLDTAVDPDHQRRGIGVALVEAATDEARRAGCEWLHVDFEPHLESFYLEACGFRPTPAGLIHLR
ncbi:GNAT family N-acetyltransferase [Actinoplanes sp. CA-030573]|uniref:GNAT family N-acetyltransferase n=1 Tax=Actinoplanes sp. CA-030573 TaxID=3239898 RepID=UPI003D8D7615